MVEEWHVRHDDEIWADSNGVGKWIANCGSAKIATQIVNAHNTRSTPVAPVSSEPFEDNALELARCILGADTGLTINPLPRCEGPQNVRPRYAIWRDDLEALAKAALKSVAPVSPVEHQHTVCASCLVDKPTPLRRNEMGGYVCLTCVDQRLDSFAAFNELCKLTFAIQHNPNCPHKFLIRLPGKSGYIDLKPYGDQLGFRKHETQDVIGSGKTLHEAYQAARAALEASE